MKTIFGLLFVVNVGLTAPLPVQQYKEIQHFVVKETLSKNGKLAIVATDASGHPLPEISGTYQFVINGFQQELLFSDGVAVTPHRMETSAFVFVKHVNTTGSHGRLYYVLKRDHELRPIAISWYFLILIPAFLLLVAYLFRRLMLLAIAILIGLFVFNYSKGLDLENILETIVHGLKELI